MKSSNIHLSSTELNRPRRNCCGLSIDGIRCAERRASDLYRLVSGSSTAADQHHSTPRTYSSFLLSRVNPILHLHPHLAANTKHHWRTNILLFFFRSNRLRAACFCLDGCFLHRKQCSDHEDICRKALVFFFKKKGWLKFP